jgi:hypothetical protein
MEANQTNDSIEGNFQITTNSSSKNDNNQPEEDHSNHDTVLPLKDVLHESLSSKETTMNDNEIEAMSRILGNAMTMGKNDGNYATIIRKFTRFMLTDLGKDF